MRSTGFAGTWYRESGTACCAGMLAILAALGCRSVTSGRAVPLPEAGGRVDRGEHVGPEGTRAWRLFVPAAVKQPATMLVLLHGCLQDAADIAAGSRMDAVAAEGGFAVLYPEQTIAANPRKCWNWFDAAHQSRGRGEPAILAGMVAEVAHAQGIDAQHVHLAGISAGAGMSVLVAAAYPEQFASVSLMSGVAWRSATNVGRALAVMKNGAGASVPTAEQVVAAMGANARAIPTLILHGDQDAVLNVRNGDEASEQSVMVHDLLRARGALPPLRHVTAAPRVEHGYAVTEHSWLDERDRPAVMYLKVAGLGHAWSGGAPAGTFTDRAGPDASRLVARFIAQHALPPRQ